MRKILLLTLLATAVAVTPALAATALVGGTVHTVSGQSYPNGTVVIDNGKIIAVGANVSVPAGAERIDISGQHVYPGMVAANSVLGLIEIGSVKGTNDAGENGNLNPNARAMVAINHDSELIPVTRANGVLTAVTATNGGVLSGSSVAWNLHGWNWEEMAIQEPLAMHLRWPSMTTSTAWWVQKSEEEQKKDREKKLKELTEAFDNAEAYHKARLSTKKGGAFHPVDVRWEAMVPVLEKKLPLFVHADEFQQIEAALDFAKEREFKIVIIGGRDAPRLADRLVKQNVPVVVDNVHQMPRRSWEPYDAAYTVAARLHEAGVKFCISTGGSTFGASNLRNLPYHAAMAASYGLPKEEALKAVTMYPAEIIGLGNRLGSIEEGKDANLFVTDGDPLEIMTTVHHIWIAGEKVDVASRHTALYERYRERPRRDGKESALTPSPAESK
ncbi:MAG: amidohydrolase family protein [Candidatus Eisenbacteria bacterium]|uniref:Amidohydrolase family protein n=1 Tax=Eiseniibacteriota bacterium TaxID=2212470 RepID=A0A7Y2EGL8_UNCEI|nr:amidohydrolase family protein [Candidatus Eisenbacteria bacterium]